VIEAGLAYSFSPGSYTYSCLNAILDAQQIFPAQFIRANHPPHRPVPMAISQELLIAM
jgi:hypothetical protein